jgi:hypothetical protein
MGVEVPEELAVGMTDANPETRKLSSGLASALMTQKSKSAEETAAYNRDIEKMREQIRMQKEADIEKDKAKAAAENAGGIPGVPKALQPKALEEIGSKKDLNTSLDFISQQFANARTQSGLGAAVGAISQAVGGPPTDSKGALDRIGESVTLQLDKMLGHEVNSDVRERIIQQYGPRWYDSDETLAAKEQGFKSAVQSLSKGTPVLQAFGIDPSTLQGVGGGRPDGMVELEGQLYTPQQVQFMKDQGLLG